MLSRAGASDRVTGLWFAGHGAPALVVDPAGAAAARKSAPVEALLRARRAVLLIDAFHAVRDQTLGHFTTFNPTDDACRVQDILTALAWLHRTSSAKPELFGLDKAAVWSLFAAAVAPIDLKLDADLGSFKGSDDDFVAAFFVPGIQRAGGLDVALKLTAGRK